MKKVATNTLATLVLIGVMSLSSINVSALSSSSKSNDNKQALRKLEKVYQRHDRKMELRASVLGVSAEQLRTQLREKSLETIVKKHGFKNMSSFYTAVTGKLKHELRQRGWSEKKLEERVQKRMTRLTASLRTQPAFSV